jgi:hypothetical protein
MLTPLLLPLVLLASQGHDHAHEHGARLIARPEAFKTLVNPACSHCRDEAKRRAGALKDDDRVLCWLRGYSDGGAIPLRFFLAPYRVISDSYGVFVYDPEAGYARGFAPSYEFRFHGWRNGVMVMQHKDGTLFSCLTGLAFAGPRKGSRLTPIPTLTSDWGYWLKQYPQAVAYHMYDKYQPMALPAKDEPASVQSRGMPDIRLKPEDRVLGVWTGKKARAYPLARLEKDGIIHDEIDGVPVVVLWEPRTRSAAAYRPLASQPRKFKGPQPDDTGASPADAGTPLPAGSAALPPRPVSLALAFVGGRFIDRDTKSFWDVAGRCVGGELKGYTLEWHDSVEVKWLAWAAEYPETSIFGDPRGKMTEIAGRAEFLRLLPKRFARLEAVDAKNGTVRLTMEGETEAKTWPVEPDAEIKVAGWWGRLEQFTPDDRVWVWLKLDRKKAPVSVVMLADELTEQLSHAKLGKTAPSEASRFDARLREMEAKLHDLKKEGQKLWLAGRWREEGLPGTLALHHVFSGELEVVLDHEAMRWGRALQPGDQVQIHPEPVIKAIVKSVTPWHERTVIRLVVGELESADLKVGQRLHLLVPPRALRDDNYPTDLDRVRSRSERIDWFLATIYCTCGVGGNTCTGHFYTLASCNPNACGMPNTMRAKIGELIDQGLTDRQILDTLLKESGPFLLQPHLRP